VQMVRHCRIPRARGCRLSRAAVARWEYMLSFKGERRLLMKMETAAKYNCALSNIVVNLCERFTHLTSK
jgi:hypothetical protein